MSRNAPPEAAGAGAVSHDGGPALLLVCRAERKAKQSADVEVCAEIIGFCELWNFRRRDGQPPSGHCLGTVGACPMRETI